MFEQDLQQGLMQAVPFTSDELSANRNGMLSEIQKNRLKRESKSSGILTLIPAFFVIFMVALIVYFIFLAPDSTFLNGFAQDPSIGLAIGGILILPFLLVLYFALRPYLRGRDARRGKVSIAEGKARVSATRVTLGFVLTVATTYELKIGGINFYVKHNVLDNIIEGAKYRIYFVKNYPANTLLSLEELKA
jgi:hypothetical protein